jgi:hypothetical protein
MISGFVVGYDIFLVNIFYLNNDPLSRFHAVKTKTFSDFWISPLVNSSNTMKISFHPMFYAVKWQFETVFMQL